MAKRGRGRPKKITSHNLSDHSGDRGDAMVKSDGKVLYSDELAEFFKIYVPAMCSETMRIPPDFIEKFGGNIPTIVTLRRPSGMTWQVEVKRSINEQYWFFQKGWPDFVKENLVEDGDFMTFSYAGNSVFCVKLFARNGCRKRVLNDSQPIENLQDRHETLLSQPPENSKRNGGIGRNTISARESDCRNPCFSIMLVKSYKRKGYLHIPMKFWKLYIRKHESIVTLRVNNNSWRVRLMSVEDRVVLSKGWPKFTKDNSLRTGNLCTFELIDSINLVFNVTVDK